MNNNAATAAPPTTAATSPAPASSASSSSSTTTTPASVGPMTQEIRDKIIEMHNYRSNFQVYCAKGIVRNGKEGNPNCPMATNMYEMRYDMMLEAEAQAYADTCALYGSDVSSRPLSGENVYTSPSTTISFFDAFVNNGVNAQMKYTRFLEQKPIAPIQFTQMVWANSYKIGCGVRRCSSGTFIRYDMTLEAEAQAYADTCALYGSDVSSRPLSGENVYTSPSTTISFFDAFVNAQKNWFSQIYKNGVNAQMKYTRFLEQKPIAPIQFTQMVWANSYKIGCGVRRCSSGTFIVCRYRQRGNIYDEFIYRSGAATCAACRNACTADGLCIAPSM
ncbi:SCP-like protein [Ancylostoma duodenale]|uniref:SCP-like protein n=1 Tax=Ancylostoma duodenale TaxID=51022 RepID=A0A0C2CXP0_9BILA|nr:SCP-like protein [Ancylostoma duodenale]